MRQLDSSTFISRSYGINASIITQHFSIIQQRNNGKSPGVKSFALEND